PLFCGIEAGLRRTRQAYALLEQQQRLFQVELARLQPLDDVVQPLERGFEASEGFGGDRRVRGYVAGGGFRASHGALFSAESSVLAGAASLSSKEPRASPGTSKTPSGSANAGNARPPAMISSAPRVTIAWAVCGV